MEHTHRSDQSLKQTRKRQTQQTEVDDLELHFKVITDGLGFHQEREDLKAMANITSKSPANKSTRSLERQFPSSTSRGDMGELNAFYHNAPGAMNATMEKTSSTVSSASLTSLGSPSRHRHSPFTFPQKTKVDPKAFIAQIFPLESVPQGWLWLLDFAMVTSLWALLILFFIWYLLRDKIQWSVASDLLLESWIFLALGLGFFYMIYFCLTQWKTTGNLADKNSKEQE